jgi:outer membrane protein OmpA-like peptidoglycan-associated protein
MTLKVNKFLKIFILGILIASTSYAESDVPRDSLSTYYLQLKNLQEKNASILTPDLFKKTINNFKKANDAITANDSLEYRQQLSLIKNNISVMEETINQSQDIFEELFIRRQQAIRHGAKKYAKTLWQQAEKYLDNAVNALNREKYDKSSEFASSAVENYKLAEFQAIKQKYLSAAIIAINKAKETGADRWSPISYRQAIEFMKEAESVIQENPNKHNKIKETALKAEQEAIAAEYYARIISKSADKPQNFEKILIKNRNRLSAYSALLGIKSDTIYTIKQFDETISIELDKIVNERKMLISEINSYENELERLKIKIDSCRQKQKREQDYKKKISFVKSLFRDEDADVIITDSNITLRLYDIKFTSANTSIPPEYFGVFNKVIRTINEFDNQPLMIVAHRDSRGNAAKNKQISEKQALAVKEFLLQNLENYTGIIDTLGMGEAKPIASNASTKGRAMNRRIEVVIQLSTAK